LAGPPWRGCAGVFHLAWATVPSTANANPLADLETNVAGTVRILEALRCLPKIPILFASSGGTVYGEAKTLPLPEDHPLRPKTAYGVSKTASEHYALLYRRLWGLDTRIVRLSNPLKTVHEAVKMPHCETFSAQNEADRSSSNDSLHPR
jgi:UDP-glucose 4-epimerase